jgi:hypothetical protein
MSIKKWSAMICSECLNDCDNKDFIFGSKICYKCIYRKKTKNLKKQILEKIYCRTCHNEILRDEVNRKNNRTIFCSKDCYEVGQKFKCNNHWTRKLRKEFPLFL